MMHMLFDIELTGSISEFFMSIRYELMLFVAALAAHYLLFGGRVPRRLPAKSAKAKVQEWASDDAYPDAQPLAAPTATPQPRPHSGNCLRQCGTEAAADPGEVKGTFKVALERGDHRQVLRCWTAAKKCSDPPSISLAKLAESMRSLDKDSTSIVRELQVYFKKCRGKCSLDDVNQLFEVLVKRTDVDLMEKVLKMLPGVGLKPDQRTYEALLGAYFATRSFPEMRSTVDAMAAEKVPFTMRGRVLAIKMALKLNNLSEAVQHFREVKSTMISNASRQGSLLSPSVAPQNIVSQLVDFACREHQLDVFFPELQGMAPIPEEVVRLMLEECVGQKNTKLLREVEKFARKENIQFSDKSYSILVQGFAGSTERVRELLEEVLARGSGLTPEFATGVLAACGRTRNVALADRLYGHMKTKRAPVLSAFIRFYLEAKHYERACDICEQDVGVFGDSEAHGRLLLDARTEQGLMDAALECGRDQLAKKLLDASPSSISQHIAMIRKCGATGKLQECKKIFNSLEQSGVELNSVVYNTILDACVHCRDLQAAEAWMKKMEGAGMADIVSYNTLMKGHLQNHDIERARAVMKDAESSGLKPNQVSFNELVNAMVTLRGSRADRKHVWEMLDEMRAAGVSPNQVTCSILLKDLDSGSSETDIAKTMDLVAAVEEPMDEVLLSSVVEACVRIGKPDLLAGKLRQLQGHDGAGLSSVTGSQTFGSLIKAFGCARDIDGVWRCWREMRSRHIRPTSITFGCMVEAVVNNGDTEGAYELIHQVREDEQCRAVLNAVIYCSVLKGFTREKKLERAWAVYDEMHSSSVDLSVVTYNTLLDACARCARMDRVPEILRDMKRMNIKPNVITYSTMLKGHCQAGDIQTGFKIMEEMRQVSKLQPDEIMYNSLLDGCAQNGFTDEGLKLLKQMQESGVQPSNFTLSIIVKLLSRARKLDVAFRMVDSISKEFGFRPNVHVFTNLVQACVSGRQLQRGLSTFEEMLKQHVRPESRTYLILIRACVSSRLFSRADGLLRAALSLKGACSEATRSVAACASLDYKLVNETLVAFATKSGEPEMAAALLRDIKQYCPRVHIDAATQQHVMAKGLAESKAAAAAPRPRPWRVQREA